MKSQFTITFVAQEFIDVRAGPVGDRLYPGLLAGVGEGLTRGLETHHRHQICRLATTWGQLDIVTLHKVSPTRGTFIVGKYDDYILAPDVKRGITVEL